MARYDSHAGMQALEHDAVCSVLMEGTKRRSDTGSRQQPPKACLAMLLRITVVSKAIKAACLPPPPTRALGQCKEESAASRGRGVCTHSRG